MSAPEQKVEAPAPVVVDSSLLAQKATAVGTGSSGASGAASVTKPSLVVKPAPNASTSNAANQNIAVPLPGSNSQAANKNLPAPGMGPTAANAMKPSSNGASTPAPSAALTTSNYGTNQTLYAHNNMSLSDTSSAGRRIMREAASQPKPDMKKAEKTPSEAEMLDAAMKSFNSADYNAASDVFDKILKHNPDNPEALYFGGISDYITGKTAHSEGNFDKLLKKGAKYTDGSKWYKANILLKSGNKEAAKNLLQDLSNSNGAYKERAMKKLSEMGY